KRSVEPFLTCALGIIIVMLSPVLGFYLVVAASAMLASVVIRIHEEREQLLDATDAMIDMMTHQNSLADQATAENQPRRPAACVTRPDAPSHRPAPRRIPQPSPPADVPPAPKPQPEVRRQPAPEVPAAFYEGLSEPLQRLLNEDHGDE